MDGLALFVILAHMTGRDLTEQGCRLTHMTSTAIEATSFLFRLQSYRILVRPGRIGRQLTLCKLRQE